MKYIRTENSVYEFVDFSKTNGMKCTNHYGYKDKQTKINMLMTLKESKNYKQADTIEELCNEFVFCEDNRYYCVVGDVEAKEMAATNYGTIFGAIWSYKGLIYVAKMNEKGELELL